MKAASEKRRGSAALIWILSLFAVSFVIWANNAPLAEIVRGPGVIVPASSAQIVQSLEGGILDEINVSEGDTVEVGQVIAKLNRTKYLAEVRDFESQILTIEARLIRLQAELGGAEEIVFPATFHASNPMLVTSEENLFHSRLLKFNSEFRAAEEQLALDQERVETMEELVSQGALPALDLLDARSAATDALFARDNLVATFELERSDEISRLVSDLARLRAQVEQSKDQLVRSSLVSPTTGIVNTIYTTTVGGVVQSGEPIFEITPLNDELLVEVRIQPKDIAFLSLGMFTTIKLSAYDYTIHGSLQGEISQISADTFEDNQAPDQEPYYKVLIALDKTSLATKSDVFDVRPGMLADAEVHVGERTVMQYLLKPLIKTQEALREP